MKEGDGRRMIGGEMREGIDENSDGSWDNGTCWIDDTIPTIIISSYQSTSMSKDSTGQ